MRTALLVVHLGGLAAWLGADAVQLALASWFAKQAVEARAAWAQAVTRLGLGYYNAAGTVIGVTGVALVLHGHWSWGAGFIWVGVVALVQGAGLGISVFVPLSRRLLAEIRAGRTGADVQRRLLAFLVFDVTVLVITMTAMVSKFAS